MHTIIFVIGVVILSASGLKTANPDSKVSVSIGAADAVVEIAASPEKRRLGLMHRDFLERNEGMLFVFPKPRILNFWMKGTPLPLDIAFFDPDGKLIAVESMVPFDTTPVTSPALALYALEMNPGWFSANGVSLGDQLKLPRIINAK